ncbi:MAG: outer membrane lipoprotein carrier protein LolA [bacterium]|nr:outer membrane lipoprotein carrier protein LolA [bacterium]
MFRMCKLCVAVIALVALVVPASAADLDEVHDKLVEAQSKLKSYSTKFKQVNHISKSMKFEGEGTYEWMRADGVIKYRKELRSKMTHDMGGEKMVNDENRTSLADGKYLYSINNDNKTIMKQNFDPEKFEAQDVASVLGHLRMQSSEVNVLPDEKVAGYDCYVIECKEDAMDDDEDDPDPMISVTRELHWFAKDLGMAIKIEGYDKKGKVVRSHVCSDIQKNPKIKADRFYFKAPEGANVSDRTQE